MSSPAPGVSADSGISTFRDSDGLWDKYRIEDVCTPEALARNRKTVIDFYNIRRRELLSKEPNAGHYAIRKLEDHFDVEVVTQNIDDLHERAGSTHVTHLHGELRKLRSSADESLVVPIEGWEQHLDDRAPDGSLLRPFVVFFGEGVPMFDRAARIAATADLLIVVGHLVGRVSGRLAGTLHPTGCPGLPDRPERAGYVRYPQPDRTYPDELGARHSAACGQADRRVRKSLILRQDSREASARKPPGCLYTLSDYQ